MQKYIVITNDDGIANSSTVLLKNALDGMKGCRAMAVVPSGPRSAISHAITLHKPMRLKKLAENYYSLSGTPADCVRFCRLHLLKKDKIALVVSGINLGLNLGYDINYSGTAAGAREAQIWNGIPSMALSMLNHSPGEIKKAIRVAAGIASKILENLTKADFFYNINFPDKVNASKIKTTCIGNIKYRNVIQKRLDPRGEHYYWQAGRFVPVSRESGTDVAEYLKGYISVTPVSVNAVSEKGTNIMEELLNEKD